MGKGSVFRKGAVTAGIVVLAACGKAAPAATPISPSPVEQARPTSTPFLPRGFSNLPSSETSPRPAPLPTPGATDAVDLSAAIDRLSTLRAGEGLPPVSRSDALDGIAMARSAELSTTRSVWHVPPGGRQAAAEAGLSSVGFSGRVGEIALAVDSGEPDPLGVVLQAVLTDPQNRAVAFDPLLGAGGIGWAVAEDRLFVVLLLAEAVGGD
jgi:uncharacterized protein YkwD